MEVNPVEKKPKYNTTNIGEVMAVARGGGGGDSIGNWEIMEVYNKVIESQGVDLAKNPHFAVSHGKVELSKSWLRR